MKFLHRYNHAEVVAKDFGDSMTSQQYKSECDVNDMMRRFKCGQPLPVKATGVYGDFSAYGDFEDCLAKVTRAREDFEALPSHIRERFGHNPEEFVRFCLAPENEAECVRLGLRVKPEPTASDRVIATLDKIAEAVTRQGEEVPLNASVQR